MHKLTPNPRAHCSAFGYGVGHLSGRAPTMCERALDTPRAQPGFPHPTIARKPFIDSTVFAPVSELIRSRIGDQSTCLSCQSLASVSMVSQRALHYQPASTQQWMRPPPDASIDRIDSNTKSGRKFLLVL